MKIFTIVGARPNFLKIDSLLPHQYIIHTGQHYGYEMSQSFFNELRLPKPYINLGCKGAELGRMYTALTKLYKKEKPNLIQVFGDTNSSLAGALVGAHNNILVAHVEAGMRSKIERMPEEINREVIDRIATIKFCPTHYAAMNLLREGITQNVFTVGDSLFDTMGSLLPIERTSEWRNYLFFTIHRNFTVDNKEKLSNVFNALAKIEENIIFPIHPRTKKNIRKFQIKVSKNIKIIRPTNYLDSLKWIANARMVITDSGGIQREAFWLNVPIIILREETEWQDIILKKAGILVGQDEEKIIDAVKNFKGVLVAPPKESAKKKIREILYRYV